MTQNQILIIFDFSTIHETARFKLKILSCCVHWKEGANSKHRYFDFLAIAKHDYRFVDYAFKILPYSLWDLVRVNLCNKEIFIWSDGGVKSNNALGTFQNLASVWRCTVHINFFAPHHGHSVVDAHFGTGKKTLRRWFPPPTMIKTIEDVVQAWKTIPLTNLILLEAIPDCREVKKIPGIKKWFQVTFSHWQENTSKIYPYEKTGDATTFCGPKLVVFK